MDHQQRVGRMSRRQFLRLWAPSVGGIALLARAPSVLASSADASAVPAILIDVSRCVGCGNCQRCCAEENNLPACDDPQAGLTASTYTFVDLRQLDGGQVRFVKRGCMHCLEPACVSACPVGALHQSPEGVVVADTTKCIGCRYCQYACPFGVPKFEWEQTLGVMRKCTSCYNRLAEGEAPACVCGCPSGALKFGQRNELLAEAHGRLAAHPDHYVDHVYGEIEVGGTERLYISDVPFEQLGLPLLDASPVPHYAESVMTRTPVIAAGVAAVSTLAYVLLRRSERELRESEHTVGEKH